MEDRTRTLLPLLGLVVVAAGVLVFYGIRTAEYSAEAFALHEGEYTAPKTARGPGDITPARGRVNAIEKESIPVDVGGAGLVTTITVCDEAGAGIPDATLFESGLTSFRQLGVTDSGGTLTAAVSAQAERMVAALAGSVQSGAAISNTTSR
jgi:hypothetical protein